MNNPTYYSKYPYRRGAGAVDFLSPHALCLLGKLPLVKFPTAITSRGPSSALGSRDPPYPLIVDAINIVLVPIPIKPKPQILCRSLITGACSPSEPTIAYAYARRVGYHGTATEWRATPLGPNHAEKWLSQWAWAIGLREPGRKMCTWLEGTYGCPRGRGELMTQPMATLHTYSNNGLRMAYRRNSEENSQVTECVLIFLCTREKFNQSGWWFRIVRIKAIEAVPILLVSFAGPSKLGANSRDGATVLHAFVNMDPCAHGTHKASSDQIRETTSATATQYIDSSLEQGVGHLTEESTRSRLNTVVVMVKPMAPTRRKMPAPVVITFSYIKSFDTRTGGREVLLTSIVTALGS
ncbi:hypothetical protein BD779DRAFT_1701120 [Infundibulicybe gibba]|nr:hypothetical protein BD779DRAFT_1701120 [Infundibulicybe gibba]